MKIKKKTFLLLSLLVLINIMGISFGRWMPVKGIVWWPVVVTADIVICFFVFLWKKEGVLPLFDIGVISMLAYGLYTIIPLFGFLYSDMTYAELSAVPLGPGESNAPEIAALAWRYVVFISSFAFVYLFVRGYRQTQQATLPDCPRRTAMAVVLSYFFLLVFFEAVKLLYGMDTNVTYGTPAMGESYDAYLAFPLFVRQCLHNLNDTMAILKLGVILILICHWRLKFYRYLLILWLAASFIGAMFHMGARQPLVIEFLGFGLLYHHFVRPLKLSFCVWAGTLFFVVFTFWGLMRGGSDLIANFRKLIDNPDYHGSHVFILGDDFQICFRSVYDLYRMKMAGIIKHVPWQVNATELVTLIPQQFFPYDKMNPQAWYLSYNPKTTYFMFGPIAQSIVGLDWIELVLRGGILGWVFGRMHRWYVQRHSSFWITFLYFIMMVYSFYTMRSTTFSFLYKLIYNFIPAMLLVFIFRRLLITKPKNESQKSLAV